MSTQFQKGQLVAVRDRCSNGWYLRVYDHASPCGGQHYCRDVQSVGPALWWQQVKPAEEVWPEIFLGRERNA